MKTASLSLHNDVEFRLFFLWIILRSRHFFLSSVKWKKFCFQINFSLDTKLFLFLLSATWIFKQPKEAKSEVAQASTYIKNSHRNREPDISKFLRTTSLAISSTAVNVFC